MYLTGLTPRKPRRNAHMFDLGVARAERGRKSLPEGQCSTVLGDIPRWALKNSTGSGKVEPSISSRHLSEIWPVKSCGVLSWRVSLLLPTVARHRSWETYVRRWSRVRKRVSCFLAIHIEIPSLLYLNRGNFEPCQATSA